MTDDLREGESLDEALECLRLEACTTDEQRSAVAADIESQRDARLREQNKIAREEIAQLTKDMGWTQWQLAEHLDVSRALLHRWNRGDYKPQDSIILERALALIARYRNAEIGNCDLELTEGIQDVIGRTSRSGGLAVIIRRVRGVGLSFGIDRALVTSFSKYSSRAVVIDPLSDRKETTFITQLAQAVGAYVEPSADETLLGLIRELQNERFTLIIDNAERLDTGFLKILSEIKAATRCALVLAGTDQLLKNIVMNQKLAELRGDVDELYHVPESLPEQEVRLILERFFDRTIDEELLKAAIEASGKNLKRLCKVLKKVRRLGLSNKAVTPSLIRSAAKQLMPLFEAKDETQTLAKFSKPDKAVAEKTA